MPLLGVAEVPRTPFVDAGAVEAAGDVVAAGADEVAGVAFFDECCAPWTPLLVDELFTTVLFVVLLLVTLVFVVELLLVVLLMLDGVLDADVHEAGLKLFTACQSRMCRLPGHGLTMCGWLLPGP